MSLKKTSILFSFLAIAIFAIFSSEAYASQRFADVPSTHEAFHQINYLEDRGIIEGYSENGHECLNYINMLPVDKLQKWLY